MGDALLERVAQLDRAPSALNRRRDTRSPQSLPSFPTADVGGDQAAADRGLQEASASLEEERG